jgi:pyroglutamyl-peptidase
MTDILVTGFEPFADHVANPSAEIARALGGAPGRAGEVLPVSYAAAARRVRELAASHRPRVWLVLGLCAEARGLRLERMARNLDASAKPDNDGVVRCGMPILASGPASHASSLPLAELAARLDRQGIPVEWSEDAGGFLCNHVFYRARDTMAASGSDAACGLIHVPPLAALALERQIEALDACLGLLGR